MEEENKTPETNDTVTEPDARDKEIEKLKKLLSNANSEAAGYKKQLREKQSAEEQAEAERVEKQKALETDIAELRRKESESKYTAQYMELGCDREKATEIAKAKADGDEETVFSALKLHFEATKKKALNDAMDKQGTLPVGEPPKGTKTYTREDIKSMSADEINAHWDDIKKSVKK